MELDLSSLCLLADTAALVSEGKLDLTPSTKTRETGRIPKKTKKIGVAALIGPSELPMDYMDNIRKMHGRDVTLVVEKTLTATDMSRGQSRLSIPKSRIREKFLSEEEIRNLERKEGIKVSLTEPCLEISHGLQLKKWNYMSKNFFLYVDREVECGRASIRAERTRRGCPHPALVL
ncbi:hypothetical protein NL676_013619 [Syzygium grande]|nr:hypothetical protein NL676_013619 [Syzygium grande]